LDRKNGVALLVEHANNPRYKNEEVVIEDADVAMLGGSPECGGSIVVYLKGDGNGRIEDLSRTGQGDTISMGATSTVMERIVNGRLTMKEVLGMDYDEFVEELGRELIGSQTRNATLGLSTIKAAIRQYRKDRPRSREE
jgi:nitrogen fixation protein NifU and related proteins